MSSPHVLHKKNIIIFNNVFHFFGSLRPIFSFSSHVCNVVVSPRAARRKEGKLVVKITFTTPPLTDDPRRRANLFQKKPEPPHGSLCSDPRFPHSPPILAPLHFCSPFHLCDDGSDGSALRNKPRLYFSVRRSRLFYLFLLEDTGKAAKVLGCVSCWFRLCSVWN